MPAPLGAGFSHCQPRKGDKPRVTRYLAAVVLLSAAVITGCSASTGSGITTSPGFHPGTYVGIDYNSVTMMTFTATGTRGQYSGSMNSVTLGDSPVNTTLTATVAGSRISVTVKGYLGAVAVLDGTIKGTELHLQVPQPSGMIEDYVLRPGNVDQYNTDLRELHPNNGSST